MFGGGLLLVAVVFTAILLLLSSKGCGPSKAEDGEVEAVPSAEATEEPTAEPTPTAEPVPSVDISDINSQSGILVRLSDGEVVAEKDADAKIYPASMTKIMTAIVGLENLSDLNETITIDRDMYDRLYTEGASLAGFGAGDEVKAIDILYGVMLPSGAECCVGLAQHLFGSEENFVAKMNEKAAELGMDSTHFVTCTGLHDENHYTTVRDLTKLLSYALQNDTFRQIYCTSEYTTSATTGRTAFPEYDVQEDGFSRGQWRRDRRRKDRIYQRSRTVSGEPCQSRRCGIYPGDRRSPGRTFHRAIPYRGCQNRL